MRKATLLLILGMAVTFGTVACSNTANDQTVSTEIKARMFSDPRIKNSNLSISVKDGEAILEGEVASETARYAAYKIANDTPGVRHVEDHMTVKLAEIISAPAAAMPASREPAPVHRTNRSVVKPNLKKEEPVANVPAPLPPSDSRVAAQTASAPAATAPPPPKPQPQPRKFVIQPGTHVLVRMIDSIDSQVAQTGQMFRASLESPLQVDEEIVAPQHTDVMVRLAEAKSAGRVSGRSELRVELAQIILQGRTYPVVSSMVDRTGASRGKDTAVKAGGGAVLGAIIGAIAGGGKGAAIGTIAGAGAGGAVQVLTHGQQIRIPSESTLDFRLEAPVTVTLSPDKRNDRAQTRANSADTPSQP